MKNIHFDITKPVAFKEMDLELNKLTLMTGANGTGKTFMNLNVFAFSMIAGIIDKTPHLKEFSQFVVDNTFSSKITGLIKAQFDDENSLSIKFEEGVVMDIEASPKLKDMDIPPVIYMSAAMRTFDAIKMYLILRKDVVDKGQQEVVNHMLKYYKLYDIMYVERLIMKCPIELTEMMLESLKKMGFKDAIAQISVKLDECEFFAITSDGIKPLTSYSGGEQSLLNMVVGI